MALNQLVATGAGKKDDGEDRMSQLPDEIIHTILRSLESHKAPARTSVLSRRWLQLWRSYPFFEFEPSYSSMYDQFRSFVDSSSRKLISRPLTHSDSDHNSYATVEAIRDVRIALWHGKFRKEDLDRLLMLLIGNAKGLSPDKFALSIRARICLRPFYSLKVTPNWSRMKSVTLYGCDLVFATPILGTHDNDVVSLSSLEFLELENVFIGEELLHSFLVNAPCLVSLTLINIYGIDRVEIVSSPCLEILYLRRIYKVDRRSGLVRDYCNDPMRMLRILSPKLESLSIWLSKLDELVIDAPNLISLAWNVRHGEPIAKVKIVSLASTCQSTINLFWYSSRRSTLTWLRLFLSTMFTQFHHLNLVVLSYFTSSQQQLSEYASLPPKIDKLQIGKPFWEIHDISQAAALVYGLFCACLPKFVSIIQDKDNDLIAQYMCRMYLKSDDSSNGMNAAATSSSWSRHLQDMKVENEITCEMMKISEDVIQSLAKQKQVRFMLIWF